ncbi:MAG: MATE family efflux transporter [Chloroflexota bacterium]|nr:MATE family efflux transporter [Chloroflexota bacterium]
MASDRAISIAKLKQVGGDWELRRMVFLLALPAVGEQVLNTAVGLTDQFLVGHLDADVATAQGYDRAMALASVGLANMLVWITTTLFIAVAVGVTAVVARRIGERREEEANLALRQALLLSVVVGVIGTLIGFFGGEWILRLLGASSEVAVIGAEYLRIVSLSFVPAAVMFAGTAALRGAGDTRSPLYLMAVVNVINILLSWLLVNGNLGLPGLGVNGSAIGTAVSRTLAGVILLALFAFGRMRLKVSHDWRPHWDTIRKIVKIGLPSAGELFIFQAAILVMAFFITALGTVAYAAHTVAINIESVSFLPGLGFAIAATALVGQALGAEDPELAERATWEALLQGGLMMTIMGLIMAAWPATIISWIAPDPAVIEQAVGPLRLAGLAQPLLAMAFIFIGALRGAGDTIWPLGMRIIATWIVRVPLMVALLALTEWGLFAIWLAMFGDFAVQSILSLARFQGGKWKTIQI